ncbi:hypothetical protein VP01_3063g2 [Puccinia sorghi]|uniref:Uncharacterized protein n=1 Tax=Puccinia sorghi TaxID=27349 RepID=A0A0L6V1M4_9BASI|nr:hypothetical protein VP01_3063g2 [Puccinia sorghi]
MYQNKVDISYDRDKGRFGGSLVLGAQAGTGGRLGRQGSLWSCGGKLDQLSSQGQQGAWGVKQTQGPLNWGGAAGSGNWWGIWGFRNQGEVQRGPFVPSKAMCSHLLHFGSESAKFACKEQQHQETGAEFSNEIHELIADCAPSSSTSTYHKTNQEVFNKAINRFQETISENLPMDQLVLGFTCKSKCLLKVIFKNMQSS